MSSAAASEGVPCPREVWRAAVQGDSATLTVTPDARSARSGDEFQISGEITKVRKIGTDYACNILIRIVPDDELAPVEIEAEKERGGWSAFRAFVWEQSPRRVGPQDHTFRYVGRVTGVDIPEGRWTNGEPASEVTA